ncbi:MAG: pyrimidine 5'-nucleotidase [Chloroflexi bacterium]|nr:pyrimidine 5'-nucleotidase [Anaerolineaceae bacterium]NMB88347.1 pyrimidine 5'-nucleotidase [Chloroflexota bacterium]
MSIRTIFFDLDDTLYPADSGVWMAIQDRIHIYMRDRLHIPADQIVPLRKELFNTYGTTLRGLQHTREIDTLDYLDYVHDIPLAQFFPPNPGLRTYLQSLPQRKIIFTNSDRNHARRVLKHLGVEDCFELLIDILDLDPYCKPQEAAFQIALRKAGEDQPQHCALIDDNVNNLATARSLGFYTVWVGAGTPPAECNGQITCIAELAGITDTWNGYHHRN